MSIDRVFFGIGGLVIGIVLGFLFANSINRSGFQAADTPANVNLPPDHPTVASSGAQTQGGAVPQVSQALEKAKSEPNNFEAQVAAGDLYYQIQRFADAAAFYERASQLRPSEVGPIVKAGNAYFDAGQYESAENWYLEALIKTPKDTSVRTDLGLTYYLSEPRSFEKAIKEFETVLSIEPDKEITLQNLALAYRDSGDQENYQKTLDKLRSINPNNPLIARPAAGGS